MQNNVQNTNPDGNELSRLSNNLKLKADEFAEITENHRKFHKAISQLAEYDKKGWPIHFVNYCDAKPNIDVLRLYGETYHSDANIIRERYSAAKGQINTLMNSLPKQMEVAAKEAGLEIGRFSRDPKYQFFNDFVDVEIIRGSNIAKISTRAGKITDIGADVPAIIERLLFEKKRLFDRKFKPINMLKDIRNAYRLLLKKNKNDGTAFISARKIYEQIASAKKKKNIVYKLDQFIVDLSELIDTNDLVVEGEQLELQQSKNPDQGIMLLGSAGRGMIDYLLFKSI